jgi:hypothetical protein
MTIEGLPSETTDIEALMLADFAEVIQGKLYLMGAGWEQFMPPSYPAPMRFGIAALIRVPFLESNMPHSFSFVLRREDGVEVFKIQGQVETGRPPGSRGDSALVPLAINGQHMVDKPTNWMLEAQVDNQPPRRLAIRAQARR